MGYVNARSTNTKNVKVKIPKLSGFYGGGKRNHPSINLIRVKERWHVGLNRWRRRGLKMEILAGIILWYMSGLLWPDDD